MADQLPEPMTPPECDLRGMEFMPMLLRVMNSTMFGISTGDEFKAAFALWMASWEEVPAASLPNDERMLAFLSKAKNWKRVREVAMRGWVLCSDGRWYHRVMADQAIRAWDRRLEWQEQDDNDTDRKKRYRDRCSALSRQLRHMGITPPRGAGLEKLEKLIRGAGGTPVVTHADTPAPSRRASPHASPHASLHDGVGMLERGRETGTGTGGNTPAGGSATPPAPANPPAPEPPAPEPPPPAPPAGPPPMLPAPPPRQQRTPAPKAARGDEPPAPSVLAWNAYAAAYERRYGTPPVRNARVNGQFAQLVTRIPQEDAPHVAAFYVGIGFYAKANHSVNLLLRDCEGIHTRWKTNRREDTGAPESFGQQRAARFFGPQRGAARPDDGRTIDMEESSAPALGSR